MANIPGPWDRPSAPTTPEAPSPPALRRPSRRSIILLCVLGAGALGVWGLATLFPGRVNLAGDWDNLAWGGGMVALVTASLLARRIALKEVARNLLIWGALAAALVVGYAYRDELGQAFVRVRSSLVPAYGVATGSHELVLSQDADGQFYAVGRVNGAPVTFMIDTGASDIVLSPADAKRLGVDLGALHFDMPYETANGEGRGARFIASSLELGSIRFSNVALSINQQPMRTSLLGMAFFKRLDAYDFEGRRLRLKWRDGP